MFPEVKHPMFDAARQYAETLPDSPCFYILCFPDINPKGSARSGASHYCGSAGSLRERYLEHLAGKGANLLRVNNLRNPDVIPVAHYVPFPTYDEAYAYEQYFKHSIKNSRRYCPDCGKERLPIPKG